MTAARTFRVHDATLIVSAESDRKDARFGGHAPDYETFNRLLLTLETVGFAVGRDPDIERNYPTLGRWHRAGWRETPAGQLQVRAETYPVGCNLEFYQDVAREHPRTGRYDFDRLAKMPYLIRKAFEVTLRAVRMHLIARGFTEEVRIESPVPDPLAYFNARWDGEYEWRRGTHRFDREPNGWPSDQVVRGRGRLDRDGMRLEHGDVRYLRAPNGYLIRGRVYGGINGMWLVVYGPGLRDYTHVSAHQLFRCYPHLAPRRLHPSGDDRRARALKKAVEAQDFERAIGIRDAIRRAA